MFKKLQKALLVSMAVLLVLSGMPFANVAQAATANSLEQEYEIYPTPHDVKYKDEEFVISSEANIVYDRTIDEATKNRVKEIFTAKEITLTESAEAVEGKTNVLVGTYESEEYVDQYFEDNIGVNADLFSKIDPYILSVEDNTIAILGQDTDSAFYGVTSLMHIFDQMKDLTIRELTIEDYSSTKVRGFIEGFYGIPWSDADRMSLMEFGGQFKMNGYVFAPKDDPYHRDQWDELYPADMLADIEKMVKVGIETKNHFVWTISPLQEVARLAQNFGKEVVMELLEENTEIMLEKFDQLYNIGVRDFGVHGDDVGVLPHEYVVQLMNSVSAWAEDRGDINSILFTPASYNSDWAWNAKELNDYEEGFAPDIEIFWTGESTLGPVTQYTVNRFKTRDNNGVVRRDPLFWLNWPVNDVDMTRVFLGKGEMLEPNIENLAGVVTNPMQEAEASKTSLFAVADYAWNTEDFDDQKSWEDSFKYIEPDATEELHVLAKHMSDAHPDGIRTEESEEIKGLLEEVEEIVKNGESLQAIAPEIISELQIIANAADGFLAKTKNKNLSKELKPFANALRDMVLADIQFIEAYLALETGNDEDVWTSYANGLSLREQSFNHDRPMLEGTEQARPAQKRLQPFTDTLESEILPMVEERLGVEVKDIKASIFTNVEAYEGLSITEEPEVTTIDDQLKVTLDSGQYVGLKLNRIKDVIEIEAPSVKGLTLEASLDGIQWQTVKDLKDTPEARYIRLNNKGDKAVEFTLDKFIVQSLEFEPKSQFDTNFAGIDDPMALFDGDLESFTLYRNVQHKDTFVTYDLGQVINISSLEVFVHHIHTDFPRHAVMEVSVDGENWETIMEIGNQDGPNEGEAVEEDKIEDVFDRLQEPYRSKLEENIDQDARFLRHRVTRSKEGPGKWARIHEIVINDGEFMPELNDPTVQTNVEYHPDHSMNNINDGKLNTKFRPAVKGEGELIYHVGELEKEISEITVLAEENGLANTTVSVRTKAGWSELGSIKDAYTVFETDGISNILDVKLSWDGNAQPTIRQITFEQKDRQPTIKTELEQDIIASEDKKESDYSVATWNVFSDALAKAKAVLADESSTQQEIDEALAALAAAVAGLKTVEREELENDVIASEDKKESDFTAESWKVFSDALTKAKAVLADENATQQEIEEALAALTAAIEGLKAIEPTTPEDPEEPADPADPVNPPAGTDDPSKDPSNDPTISDDSKDETDGSKLPSTATSIFNWLLVGFALVLAGGLAIFITRSRKQSAE